MTEEIIINKEIFMNMLWQACGITPPKGTAIEDTKDEYDSQCLSAYEDALAFAVRFGWIKKKQVIR